MPGVCNCLCRLLTTSLVGSDSGSQHHGVQIVCLGSDQPGYLMTDAWFHFPRHAREPGHAVFESRPAQVLLSEAFIQVQRHLHTRHRGWKQTGSVTL